MNDRLLLRTSVFGILAASLIAGTPAALASQPSSDSDPRVAVIGQPTAVPMTVGKLEAAFMILDVYTAVKQCATDAAGGSWWECFTGAFTGPSIQDVLNRIDELEKKIDRNHAELMSRLSQLENDGNQRALQDRMANLRPLANAGDDANRAWMAVLGCMRARSEGQATCADYTGSQRPIADATRDNRDEFLRIMDGWRSLNLPTVTQYFAGQALTDGVAQAGWKYFRTLQNNNAGVKTDSPVRRSDRTPVVTHALSSQMNVLLEYYQDLITRYAFLSAMADGMRTASQLNCPTADLASCRENRVRSWQDGARRWIDDRSNRYSVAGTVAHYEMPDVPTGAVAVVNQFQNPRMRRLYFAGTGGASGMSYRDLGAQAMSLAFYAPATTLAAAYPGSFPSGGWYTAQMPVRRGIYLVVGCRYETVHCGASVNGYHVNAPALGDVPCLVRGRPVDETISWDADFQTWMRAVPQQGTPDDLWVDVAGSDWKGRYIPFEEIWSRFAFRDSFGIALRRVDWDWDRRGPINGYRFGWGGSVKCVSGTQSTVTTLAANGEYPLFGAP